MTSRSAYILLGACGGLFFGILALMDPEIAALGLWVFAITGSSGAILGASLHATQRWEAHGPAGNLLRFISGLGFAGLVLGLVASALGAIPLVGVPSTFAMGLIVGCSFGLRGQQRTFFGDAGYRERTPREIALLWSLILGTLAIVCGLFALTWALAA